MKNLKFTNIFEYQCKRYWTKTSYTKYENVFIYEKIYSPSHWNLPTTVKYIVDLIEKDNEIILAGKIEQGYNENGYGNPCFQELENAIEYINEYLKKRGKNVVNKIYVK